MGSDKMIRRQFKTSAVVLALSLSFFAVGCKKKVAPAPPPPPPVAKPDPPKPEPAKPSISLFEAEPSTVEKGQSSTLRWKVGGEASEVTITPGIGTVAVDGSRQVFPSNSTTYTLMAKGPGGTDSATTTVSIAAAAVKEVPRTQPTPRRTLSEILSSDIKDAYFDYDKTDIREDARATLTRNADVLKQVFQQYPSAVLAVEGHADERGSAEYNLGLSDRRSTAAKEFLVQLGVPADRLKTVSYGRERPQCTDATETCYSSNRRVHLTANE